MPDSAELISTDIALGVGHNISTQGSNDESDVLEEITGEGYCGAGASMSESEKQRIITESGIDCATQENQT